MRCWSCQKGSIRSGRDTSGTMRTGTSGRLIGRGRGRRCRTYGEVESLAGLQSESCLGWQPPLNVQMPRFFVRPHGCFRRLQRALEAIGNCPLGSERSLVTERHRLPSWAAPSPLRPISLPDCCAKASARHSTSWAIKSAVHHQPVNSADAASSIRPASKSRMTSSSRDNACSISLSVTVSGGVSSSTLEEGPTQ